MPIEAACACGARFNAEDHLAGKTVNCPTCGQPFRIPAPQAAMISVRCTCGKGYRVKASLAGQKVQCSACQQTFIAQPVSAAASPPATRPAAAPQFAPAPAPVPQPFAPLDNSPGNPFGGPLDLGPAALGPGMPAAGYGDPWAGGAGLGGTPGFAQPGYGQPAMGMPGAPAMGGGVPFAPQGPVAMSYPAPAPYGAPAARRRGNGNLGKILLMVGGGVVALTAVGALVLAAVWYLPDLLMSGYSSPNAAFAAQQSAIKTKNWKKLFTTITPDGQDNVLAAVLLLTALGATQEPKLGDILQRYGINVEELRGSSGNGLMGLPSIDPDKARSAAVGVSNKAALFGELMTVFQQRAAEARQKSGSAAALQIVPEESTLSDVVVSGDSALGKRTTTINGKQVEGQIAFRKVEGRWYIEFATNGMQRPSSMFGGGSTPRQLTMPKMPEMPKMPNMPDKMFPPGFPGGPTERK